MYTNRDMDVILRGYRDQIAYLQSVCRIAADKLKDGGTFPIKGELWDMLDFAAGPRPTNRQERHADIGERS